MDTLRHREYPESLERPRIPERVRQAMEAAPRLDDAAALKDASKHPQLAGDVGVGVDHPSILRYARAEEMKELRGFVSDAYLDEAIEHEALHAARAAAFGYPYVICVQLLRDGDGFRVQPFVQFRAEQAPAESAVHFRRKLLAVARAPHAPSDHDEAIARRLESEIATIERAEEDELRLAA